MILPLLLRHVALVLSLLLFLFLLFLLLSLLCYFRPGFELADLRLERASRGWFRLLRFQSEALTRAPKYRVK